MSTLFLFSPYALSASPCETDVKPFLATYCLECHGGGEKVKGKVDFTKIKTQADLDAHFEQFETAIKLLREGEMPPDAAKQPGADELEKIYGSYQKRFVETVEARPATSTPRRLSADWKRPDLSSTESTEGTERNTFSLRGHIHEFTSPPSPASVPSVV